MFGVGVASINQQRECANKCVEKMKKERKGKKVHFKFNGNLCQCNMYSIWD